MMQFFLGIYVITLVLSLVYVLYLLSEPASPTLRQAQEEETGND